LGWLQTVDYSKTYGGYLDPTQRFPLPFRTLGYAASLLLENFWDFQKGSLFHYKGCTDKTMKYEKTLSISYLVRKIFQCCVF